MNIPADDFDKWGAGGMEFERTPETLQRLFKNCEKLYACDTLQCDDYKRHNIQVFDEGQKRAHRDATWPGLTESAYQLGLRLIKGES